jgi:hypothetical protein
VPIPRLPPDPASEGSSSGALIAGGRTDLKNLILLCQWHHTAVHGGGVTITADRERWVLPNRRAALRAVGE